MVVDSLKQRRSIGGFAKSSAQVVDQLRRSIQLGSVRVGDVDLERVLHGQDVLDEF
jgi:hypothetical protein